MIGIQEALDKAVEDNRKLEKDLHYIHKENEALRLLLNWAEECDWGFDNFRDDDVVNWEEFEKESENLDYIESMIKYAEMYLKSKGE